MKQVVYSFFFITAIFMLLSGAQKSSGPPGCHAGEPPLFKTCVSCHDDRILNSGSAEVLFDIGGAEQGYTPGATYNITISVKKQGMKAGGFQVIALQDNNQSQSPGQVILSEPARTQTVDKNNPHAHGCAISNKVWVEHKFQGIMSDTSGKSQWAYQWKAPDSSVGNITFYLAAVEANYDLTDGGDYTYTRTLVAPDLNTSVNIKESFNANVFRFYPNPASGELFFEHSVNEKFNQILLLDVKGVVVKQFSDFSFDGSTARLGVNDVPAGVYFAVVRSNEGTSVQKIMLR